MVQEKVNKPKLQTQSVSHLVMLTKVKQDKEEIYVHEVASKSPSKR